ncbi:MAG: beta strand repeat-containing protein [Limisphaerales bacterium]
MTTTFTTAAILSVTPTNNTSILSGQTVNALVQFEPGIGADFFRFILGGGVPHDVAVFPGSSSAAVSIPVPADITNATDLTLTMAAMKSGATPFGLPPVVLRVFPPRPDTNVVTIVGTNQVTLTEGQSSNLVVSINSPGSPLILVDYPATNQPPPFASLSGLQVTNTPAGGTASAQLNLNPLSDAAGNYTITVRAAAQNGKVGILNIAVTVLDNPALQVTHWKDPVDGNWSDATKWTAGVPGTNTMTFIDASGSFTVTLDTQPNLLGLVLNQTNATLVVNGAFSLDAPVELRSGELVLGYNQSLNLTHPLVNLGTLQFYSRDVNTYLNGSGWVENRGLMQVSPTGGAGGQAQILVPVNVTGTGRVLVATNGYLNFRAGSSLTSAGIIEVQDGGRLFFENASPARDMTVLAGSRLFGNGVLQFYGSNRLMTAGDLTTSLPLQMNDSSQVAGTGLLTLQGNQTLTGSYGSPVAVAAGASVGITGATFTNSVTIQSNGLMYVNGSQALTINSVLTNLGTLQFYSRDVNTYLNGSGWVENAGLMQVLPTGGAGGQAQILVPVDVVATGHLLVSTNGYLNFRAGSSLTSAGIVEVQDGGRLFFENASPARDMTVLAGSQLFGNGVLQFYGNNRLMTGGDLTTGLALQMNDSSQVAGTGLLTLQGNQTLTGTYGSPVAVAAGASVGITGATFTNSVTIQSNGVMYVNNNQTLTINSVFINLGTLQLYSRDVNTYLGGSGRVENAGLMQVLATGGGGGQAQILVPVGVAATGHLLVSTNGYLNFRAGSSLTSAGIVEVQDGGRLFFENASPARDMTVLAGSQLFGNGVLQFYGNNRLMTAGDLTTGLALQMNDSSQVAGTGLLTLQGSQTLTGTYGSPLFVADGASVGISGATFTGSVTIQSNGVMYVNNNQTLTINSVLINLGTLQLYSRDVNTYLNGNGSVENRGLMQVLATGGGGGQAQISLPLDVAATGHLLVSTNGYLNFRAGSSLISAGIVEVQDGGRLFFENASPARDMTVLAGSQLFGNGVLQFYGNNRLMTGGDLTTGLALQMNDSSQVAGTGLLTLQGNQTLTGTYGSPILVAAGASVGISGATFTNSVTIQSNGVMYVNWNQGLTINSVLTNLGTLQLYSRDVNTYLNGNGRMENAGLMQVLPTGGGGGQAQISLPLDVVATGRLLVNTNGFVVIRSGGNLSVAGVVEVQTDGRLRLESSSPAEELTLHTGAEIRGGGTTEIQGNNRLVLAGNATLVAGLLDMQGISQVTGPGKLTVDPGAIWRFDHNANVDGSIEIAGTLAQTGSGVTMRVDGTLTLQPTGTLTLPGTLSVGSFVNNGGTVSGTVTDDAALVVTRWLNPVSGNWSVAANWSAGLPDANKIAVIDSPGTYTVTLDANATIATLRLGAASGTQTLSMSGPTLVIINPSTAGANAVINLSGGALTGNADLAIDGTVSWTAGAISGNGTTTLGANATLTISGGSDRNLNRVLNNQGTMVWSGGRIFAANGVINNQSGAVFEVQSDQPFFDGTINNAGTLLKTAGTGTTSLAGYNFSPGPLNNSGTVNVQSGTLQSAGGGTHSGNFLLTTNAALDFSGGAHNFNGSQISGSGLAQFSGGTATFANGYGIAANTLISGGTVNFNSAGLIGGQLTVSGGTLSGSGALTVSNAMSWTGGAIAGSGSLTLAPNHTSTISGGNDRNLNRVLNNQGTMVWSGGRIFAANGVINNQSGAVFEVQSDQPFYDGTINNAGTLLKTAGTGTTSLPGYNIGPGQLNNSGTVNVQSGTLVLNGNGSHSGSFDAGTNGALIFAGGTHTLTNAVFSGIGTIRIQTAFVLATDVSFGTLNVVFENSASVSGNFTIVNAAGGTLAFNKTMTIPGSMNIGGTLTLASAGLTLTVNGTLTLGATAVLNNPGTVRVGAFVNNGGTVNGNAPVVGITPLSVRIGDIQIVKSRTTVQGIAAAAAASEVEISWPSIPGVPFTVESSTDLIQWVEERPILVETNAGICRTRLPARSGESRFYRLRSQ